MSSNDSRRMSRTTRAASGRSISYALVALVATISMVFAGLVLPASASALTAAEDPGATTSTETAVVTTTDSSTGGSSSDTSTGGSSNTVTSALRAASVACARCSASSARWKSGYPTTMRSTYAAT